MKSKVAATTPYLINLGRGLIAIDRPLVMAIVNATPDSFYADSRGDSRAKLEAIVARQIEEGADIIDVGGYSSRSGASDVTEAEEIRRVKMAIEVVREIDRNIPISVDTFRSAVARMAVEECGANMINDISGCDPLMIPTVAKLKVPYVVMHMRGTPADMQERCDYDGDVVADVITELSAKVYAAEEAGIADIIIDPGFGFSKTTEQCYRLLKELPNLTAAFNRPILVGLSRKSMAYKPLGVSPEESLNATTALNTIALIQGASILRVHDVKAARQAIDIFEMTFSENNI